MYSQAKRIPLNLFGIPFGLTGLAGLWTETGSVFGLPEAVPDAFWLIAVVVWIVALAQYVVGARTFATVVADLKHPVLGSFAALVPVVATLFGERIHASLPVLGQVWVLITTTVSFAFGAWFIKHLSAGAHEIDELHSGYFLPTVAGGLISSQALADVGFHDLALGAFTTVASGRYGIQYIAQSVVPAIAILQWAIALISTAFIGLIAVLSVRHTLGTRRREALVSP